MRDDPENQADRLFSAPIAVIHASQCPCGRVLRSVGHPSLPEREPADWPAVRAELDAAVAAGHVVLVAELVEGELRLVTIGRWPPVARHHLAEAVAHGEVRASRTPAG